MPIIVLDRTKTEQKQHHGSVPAMALDDHSHHSLISGSWTHQIFSGLVLWARQETRTEIGSLQAVCT